MAASGEQSLKLNEPRLVEPNVPEQLESVTDLEPLLEELGEDAGVTEGLTLTHVALEDVFMAGADLMLTELTESCANQCTFASCDFSKSWFVDAEFRNCDFSNCVLEDANFTRCSFVSCKFTGADATGGIFSQCSFDDCLMNLVTLADARFEDCLIKRTDLTGADLANARQTRLAFDECRFEETSFFRMSLKGVDLSTSKLGALTISDGMEELAGCCMDILQAAGIAKRLGVIIKEE